MSTEGAYGLVNRKLVGDSKWVVPLALAQVPAVQGELASDVNIAPLYNLAARPSDLYDRGYLGLPFLRKEYRCRVHASLSMAGIMDGIYIW